MNRHKPGRWPVQPPPDEPIQEVLPIAKDLAEAATERALGELTLREALRDLDYGYPGDNSWADKVWDDVKKEVAKSDEAVAAMELAETLASAEVALQTFLRCVADTREAITAALDTTETEARTALVEVQQAHLGKIRLWHTLRCLVRAAGASRAYESVLRTVVGRTFRSFHETAKALARLRRAHDAAVEAGAADGGNDGE